MVGKKQKNIILVVLASIALALLSLATCLCVSSTRAVHADADVDVGNLIGEAQEYKTVCVGEKMMYLYDLKVGDSIYGKTLVCPASINQKFSSTVVLSDGNVIAYYDVDPLLFGPDENTLLWWFDSADYGDETTFNYSPFDTAEQDYLFSAQIDNSNIKSSESEERSISEDATVVSVTNKCSSIGIMYAVEAPIQNEPEEPDVPVTPEEPDVPDTPTEEQPSQTPDVPKDDDVKDDTVKDDVLNDDNKNDVFDFDDVTLEGFVKENWKILAIALVVLVVTATVELMIIKHKRR